MSTFDPAHVVDDLISVAAHVESELEEALAVHRLSRPSYLVLAALEHADRQMLNQRELVRRVRRTAGTLSVRLGRLERAHLIVREPDAANRRSVTVTLTERGRELVKRAAPAYAERAGRLLAPLGPRAGEAVAALEAWRGFFEPDEGVAPQLGVAVATPAVARRMRQAVGLEDVPGVLVVRVADGSAAEAAGLGRGDLITHAGAAPVGSVGDLQRAVRSARGPLRLDVLRGAARREVMIELGAAG